MHSKSAAICRCTNTTSLARGGEFSAAKHGYVKTRSGWFSDRSVCYLASGRPVILQDSGFSDWLQTGRGVLAFTSLEEAIQCIEQVNADYPAHCRAAKEIAEDTFSYEKVLPRLLEIGMGRKPAPNGGSEKSSSLPSIAATDRSALGWKKTPT